MCLECKERGAEQCSQMQGHWYVLTVRFRCQSSANEYALNLIGTLSVPNKHFCQAHRLFNCRISRQLARRTFPLDVFGMLPASSRTTS